MVDNLSLFSSRFEDLLGIHDVLHFLSKYNSFYFYLSFGPRGAFNLSPMVWSAFHAEKFSSIIFSSTAFPLLSRRESIADSLARILVAQLFCSLLELYTNHSSGQQMVRL